MPHTSNAKTAVESESRRVSFMKIVEYVYK
jgi:hypothetical protein